MKYIRFVFCMICITILGYCTVNIFITSMFSFFSQSPGYPLSFWEYLFPQLIACISMLWCIIIFLKEIFKIIINEGRRVAEENKR